MKQQLYTIGADLKIKVSITNLAENVHMEDCPFTLDVFSGASGTSAPKSFAYNPDAEEDEEVCSDGLKKIDADTFQIVFSTSDMERGDVYLKVSIDIPDEDFESGVRHEIQDHDLQITLQ